MKDYGAYCVEFTRAFLAAAADAVALKLVQVTTLDVTAV